MNRLIRFSERPSFSLILQKFLSATIGDGFKVRKEKNPFLFVHAGRMVMEMGKKLSKKILVVDDDPDIRDNLRAMLTQYGYEVNTTAEATQVISISKNDPPDLILMDIWLSGSDGREISRQLKSADETRDIPIVLVSANVDGEKSSKQIGVDFLAKPFEMKDLLSKISKYCSQ